MVTGTDRWVGRANRETEDMKAVYTIHLTSAFVNWHAACAT